MKFKDLLIDEDGMIKGPFGSDVKKSLFVSKSDRTYKVYEQSVVATQDFTVGNYYLGKEYCDKKLKRFFIKPGDILMTGAGTLGLLAEVPKDAEIGIMNQALIRVRLNENVIYKPYFFYYFPWAIKDYACRINGDSVIPNLPPLSVLKDIDVNIPSMNVQIEIADRLDLFKKKIENNNKIIAELESFAKTLYDYWFLQFEFPNEKGKPYKSSGGKMLYNKELKREIPEGWKVENMMESSLCFDIKAGVDKFKSKNYLPTANIEGESITDGEYVTFDNRENRANMQPVKYSVWFAKMKNSIKHLSIPENSEWFINKYILSTGFQGLKCTETSFAYIHSVVNSSWFEIYKDVLSHGATQEGINNEDLKNIKYVVPSNKVLFEFNKICIPTLEKKFSIIRENQELASLRDFLLPMLMNGQVTFK